LTYRILFDVDVLHRGLVQVVTSGGKPNASKQTIIVRDATPIAIDLPGTTRRGVLGFVREGVWFAWLGLLHLLAVIGLVLPLAAAAASRRDAIQNGARTFGAFAAGTAVTLALAASGTLDLPERWVDLAIAVSVIGVAVMNLARVDEARWDLAFEIGLVHGLGLALEVRYLDVEHRVGSLLGFGAGTAIGGALVVAALVPALYFIRNTPIYQAVLWGGTALVGVVAMVWTYLFL
jgi:hypothetical protein